MSGRISFWTAARVAQLRALANSGVSVDEAARALGRSRVAVRSKATHSGISFRHALNHKAARVSLPPDLALRLKLATHARGDTTVQKLAREILSSVLSQPGRNARVQHTLETAAAVRRIT